MRRIPKRFINIREIIFREKMSANLTEKVKGEGTQSSETEEMKEKIRVAKANAFEFAPKVMNILRERGLYDRVSYRIEVSKIGSIGFYINVMFYSMKTGKDIHLVTVNEYGKVDEYPKTAADHITAGYIAMCSE